MRGAGDRFTVGERVAFYRARRGLTQTELANLVGRGPDWLGKIERGERPMGKVGGGVGCWSRWRAFYGGALAIWWVNPFCWRTIRPTTTSWRCETR